MQRQRPTTSTTVRCSAARIRAGFMPVLDFFPALGLIAVLWYGGHQVLDGHLTHRRAARRSTLYVHHADLPAAHDRHARRPGPAGGGGGAAHPRDARHRAGDRRPSPTPCAARRQRRGALRGRELRLLARAGVRCSTASTSRIAAGEAVALVGPTGCGKTTVARLIPRFYDVDAGAITHRRRRRPRRASSTTCATPSASCSRTRSCSATPSQPTSRSPTPTRRRSGSSGRRALAGAHEFIVELPDGYDTEIGERGFSLSGGQRQRIAIARAILADPRVLILDDATSSVDPTKEHEIRDALRRGDARPHDDRDRPPAGHDRPGRPRRAARRRPHRRRGHPRRAAARRASATARCWPQAEEAEAGRRDGPDGGTATASSRTTTSSTQGEAGHVARGASADAAAVPRATVDPVASLLIVLVDARHRRRPVLRSATASTTASVKHNVDGARPRRDRLRRASPSRSLLLSPRADPARQPHRRGLPARPARCACSTTCRRMSMAFYDREQAGMLVSRMTSDIDSLQELVQQGLVHVRHQRAAARSSRSRSLLVIVAAAGAVCLVVAARSSIVASIQFQRDSNQAYLGCATASARRCRRCRRASRACASSRRSAARSRQRAAFRSTTTRSSSTPTCDAVRISAWYFPVIESPASSALRRRRRHRRRGSCTAARSPSAPSPPSCCCSQQPVRAGAAAEPAVQHRCSRPARR